jgi:hypothetical protein
LSQLKDEQSLAELRSAEARRIMSDQHEAEMRGREKLHEEAIAGLSKRQSEAVSALKQLHVQEMAAVRERSKDGAVLEQLASQIRSASGSMRLIEEQLLQRHQGTLRDVTLRV